jgi:hypothetical protein
MQSTQVIALTEEPSININSYSDISPVDEAHENNSFITYITASMLTAQRIRTANLHHVHIDKFQQRHYNIFHRIFRSKFLEQEASARCSEDYVIQQYKTVESLYRVRNSKSAADSLT